MRKQGNKRLPRSSNSPKVDKGDTNGEESKQQVAEHYKLSTEIKKLGEFKEDMTQKFMELSHKMTNMDLGETKNWKS